MSNHFYAYISRMKNIYRWGLMRNSRNENLSEHSLEVSIIAHALCLIGNKRLGKNYDAEHIAVAAMFHDTSEIITGDLPTPIKYYNPEINKAYKQIESVAEDKLLSMLPEDLAEDYIPLYKIDAETKKIIKAADKLSAYIKCIDETKTGNEEFKQALIATEKAILDMGVDEAKIFLDEFIPSFLLTLDDQN